MITKQYFEITVKPLLQKLGNYRTPYLIFIDEKVEHTAFAQKTLNLAVHTALFRNNFELDKLDDITNKATVVIVIDTVDNMISNGWQYLFNEIHIRPEQSSVCNEHCKLIASDDTCNVFAQKAIELHQMRSFNSKGVTIGDVTAEPYHTLGRMLGNNTAILYIWDTREVVAVTNEHTIDWGSCKDVNDNQRPLFATDELLMQYPQLEPICVRVSTIS